MTDDIYHYVVPLPQGIDEAVLPCYSGYTIYTAERLTTEERKRAFRHALKHIYKNDWDEESVQKIESEM